MTGQIAHHPAEWPRIGDSQSGTASVSWAKPGTEMADEITPTAQGVLAKNPLVHLLVFIADRRLSGTLALSAPANASPRQDLVYFHEGAPSKAKLGEPIAHLGRVLFE